MHAPSLRGTNVDHFVCFNHGDPYHRFTRGMEAHQPISVGSGTVTLPRRREGPRR